MYTNMWYIFLEKSVKCTRKKKVQIYENKTRKKESVVTRFQVKLEEIQICELLGLISHTNIRYAFFQAYQTNSMHLKVII